MIFPDSIGDGMWMSKHNVTGMMTHVAACHFTTTILMVSIYGSGSGGTSFALLMIVFASSQHMAGCEAGTHRWDGTSLRMEAERI
jgi:hypothetical protein